MRVHQEPAFILLNRPYSESSWIVEIFSRNYGRLGLMAKGARRIKSKLKGVLLPFQPTLLSWSGKGELPTLTSAEINPAEYCFDRHELRGDALVCGFYCNELIVNLLHRHDPHTRLYDLYQTTIRALAVEQHEPVSADMYGLCLRTFEQHLIRETGYEINFRFEADGKTQIRPENYYRFERGQGFLPVPATHPEQISGRVIGLVAGASNEYSKPISAAEFSQGKHLMRDILNQTLGYKPVVSRDLFFPRER